ncbi:MAG: GNAT family N-acetyltransferase [Saprospiraceae bacterium]
MKSLFQRSVLLPEYRGQGIGVKFFEMREAQAKDLGWFNLCTFCRVVRPEDHALKPRLCSFRCVLEKERLSKMEGMFCNMQWQDIDQQERPLNLCSFWSKRSDLKHYHFVNNQSNTQKGIGV